MLTYSAQQLRRHAAKCSCNCDANRFRHCASDSSRMSMLKRLSNPIIGRLLEDLQVEKQKIIAATDQSTPSQQLQPKPPSKSQVSVVYPFSTDPYLMEVYKNPWGTMRFGKMMEDMDVLGGAVAFYHTFNGTPNYPMCVTASVDRIRLAKRPLVTCDQHLSGKITYVGNSSMEIKLQCCSVEDTEPWVEAYFTFVSLDRTTMKPCRNPPLLIETEEEKLANEMGARRAMRKRQLREGSLKQDLEGNIGDHAQRLLEQAGTLINMPSLADSHSILMNATKIQNAEIAQPQVQNSHGRIFGGFLMRRAFELSFANAYMFGGARPIFLEVDEISFGSPVDVGDLLVFNSKVIYTEETLSSEASNTSTKDATHNSVQKHQCLVHIEVEAWITVPEKTTAKVSNRFYLTYAMPEGIKCRTVLPSNIDEAWLVARRIHSKYDSL